MTFLIFQSREDPGHFLVTDEAHSRDRLVRQQTNPPDMIRLGRFAPMGDRRAAFNEKIACSAIRAHGYYEFDAHAELVMGVPA